MTPSEIPSAASGDGGDQHARVREAAVARGLAIDIRQRPAANSLIEAAELLGIDPSGIVKTLVVKHSDDTYLFALVPGGRSISWPKLRALVGVNKLCLPEPALALAATGYERGTVVLPIGSTTDCRSTPTSRSWGIASQWVQDRTDSASSLRPMI